MVLKDNKVRKGTFMKKVSKIVAAASVLGMAVVAASCSKSGGGAGGKKLEMWVGFGNDYTGEITRVVEEYNSTSESYKVNLTTKGAYTKLETAIVNSIGDTSYPNIANGYPDHFAEYVHAGIMVPLNKYIKAWNEKTGKNLMDDFYDAYEKENENIYFDAASTEKVIMGLPFNKSTEVMIVNGHLWDYVRSVDNTIPEDVPESWQALSTVGPKIVTAMSAAMNINNNFLWGKVDANNVASDFSFTKTEAEKPADKVLIQDFSQVQSDNDFRVLGYDDGGNAFTTILRQWGVTYTDFSRDIYFQQPAEYGRATFWRDSYNGVNQKEKTLEAMWFIKGLFNNKVFGLPQAFGESQYCTKPFKAGKCMFTIGSSGGLSNSVDANNRIEIHHIPYYDDGVTVRKAVISQGTSLGLFNQFSSKDNAEAERQAAFDAMVAICTGELQGSWVSATGYFPSSISAMNSTSYDALLKDTNPTPLRKMYQMAAALNKDVYDKDEANKWDKFVDHGFLGSSAIRTECGGIIQNICAAEGMSTQADVSNYLDTVWAKTTFNTVRSK